MSCFLLSCFNGNNKSSSSSSSSRRSSRRGDGDDYIKAYKVYPSDEDRGRWVGEPGIDRKASAYISSTTDKWNNPGLAY
ncbi:hypothetical protein ACJIZ3_015871 [Penstemon smallii]|uniref:Uncharacterized protein n=1 Tax=Penstemon smallii TaxID=265156 RepID=A0ABD3RNZ7_9LAMI